MEKHYFYLIVSLAAFCSCQREMDFCQAPEIRAEVETQPDTRTVLSMDESGSGTIYWMPEDIIDVFFGTNRARYTSQNSKNAKTAVFKTSDAVSGSDILSTNIWGLYPSNSSSSCDGTAIRTSLPSQQYGVPESFDDDLFISVAHSNTTSLQFYNICGGIKFNLFRSDIKSIRFRGNNNENLAGDISISFENGLPKVSVVNGVKEITVTPKSGKAFAQGKDYYIVMLPGTLSNGFTVTFTKTDGRVGTLSYYDKSVTIKRAIFSKKKQLDIYAAFSDNSQPNSVIYYTSSSGTVITPFRSDVFGSNIVSNEYVSGRGVITFDGDVLSIGNQAFYNRTGLTSITIPNSVTSIGNNSFYNCTGLTSITIPSSVTSIGSYSFSFCDGLTSITIPSSVTSIGSNPFRGCSKLGTIVVASGNPYYDSRNNCNAIISKSTNALVSGCKNTIIPSSVTSIGVSAFESCSGLTSITIPKSVTSIGDNSFNNCDGLISISIPNSVTSIGYYSFSYCDGLTSITIPSSVTSIGYNPFRGCSKLGTIVVASGNPYYDSRNNCNAIISKSTNALISGCKNTVIPNSVTSIGVSAFESCYGLRSIEIPESISRIRDYAFFYCSGLTSITVLAQTPPSIGYDILYSTNNCPIYVLKDAVNSYKSSWSDYASRIQACLVEPVDLGLSVEWASWNLGATRPEEAGDYYCWGELSTKTNYTWNTYRFWYSGNSDSDVRFTKYVIDSSRGTVDNRAVLEPSDDVASVKLGNRWRMPSMDDFTELVNNCSWQWTTINGVYGIKFTSMKPGYTNRWIFMPAAGAKTNSSASDINIGLYLSRNLFSDSYAVKDLRFTSAGPVLTWYGYRRAGFPVRPVHE